MNGRTYPLHPRSDNRHLAPSLFLIHERTGGFDVATTASARSSRFTFGAQGE